MVEWGMVECGVAVFAACLPTLQSLLRKASWKSITTLFKGYISSPSREVSEDNTPVVRVDAKTTVISEEKESDLEENATATYDSMYARKAAYFDSTVSTGSTT
jgi:hypothetical protein